MVRLHHLQTKNSCGYNLLNGKENTPVHKMVKADDEPMIDSRLQTYKEHYSMRPPYFSQ